MNKLSGQLNELQSKIEQYQFINPAISAGSVGWHVEHTLLTIEAIIATMKNSDPSKYNWKFNFPKLFVFATGKIPRGRAQSPESVRPKNPFDTVTLNDHLTAVLQRINEISQLHSKNYFEHPYFGKLNVKPAIRFIEIHTHHHLAIINDILKGK